MQTVIFAGGMGTRLSEETLIRPKPMIEIGDMPIVWHIMKMYSALGGVNEFVILLGYKGAMIKDFFLNYFCHRSDLTISLQTNEIHFHNRVGEDWKVTLVETGLATSTGGRLLRAEQHLKDTFFLTYGDGLSDVNIDELRRFHLNHGRLATLTAVKSIARFGSVRFSEFHPNAVNEFIEKPMDERNWINGGFFVMNKRILDYINEESVSLEHEPLKKLASDGELMAFFHDGFWQPMDTHRDMIKIRQMWDSGEAPWKVW